MLNDKKKKNLLSRVLDKDYPTSVNSGLIQTFQCPKFRNGTFRREKKKPITAIGVMSTSQT